MNKEKLKQLLALLQTEYDGIKLKAENESRDVTPEEFEILKAKMAEMQDIKAKIKDIDELEAFEASATLPADIPASEPDGFQNMNVKGPSAEQHGEYKLGIYLQDIAKHASGNTQPRVSAYQAKTFDELKINAAATGASESVPADGGFLVGTDMSASIAERAYNNNVLAPLADRYEITTGANGIDVLANDETSRVDGSRHGGIRHYWMAEADDKTASKPTWRRAELRLKKGAILFYATDELLADAPMLESKVNEYVGDEMSFAIQDGMVNGTGAGRPLGILNGACLVSVTKETGQAAASIVWENITKMWARFWGSRPLWIANRDTFPQLASLNQAVGTGGVPVWLPAGGAAGRENETLMGAPLIYIEQCATVGTVGDLVLTDYSQYYLATKAGIQAAMSIHVEFVADETVFRWVHRVDGQPAWNAALTPYKGGATKTRSPFVALAARA